MMRSGFESDTILCAILELRTVAFSARAAPAETCLFNSATAARPTSAGPMQTRYTERGSDARRQHQPANRGADDRADPAHAQRPAQARSSASKRGRASTPAW